MMFLHAERLLRRRLARPARLIRLALLPLASMALLWAAGAALPGLRGDLAALSMARSGAMPRSAPAAAVRVLDGVVLVAPAAGRFEPAVADGARVARGTAVAAIEGFAAPALTRAGAAAAQALHDGAMPAARRGLLTSRAAAATSLAAASTAAVPAPAAGTVRWRLSAAGQPAPAPGQWVTAGQPLGTVSPPASAWRVQVRGAVPSGLRAGARVQIAPLGLSGRVTRIAGGALDVTAGPAAAGGDGRPLAVTLAWGRASGTLVPAGAVVRQGRAAWVLAAPRFAGTLRWMRVLVLAAGSGRAVVTGLPPGAWVAARPWLAGLWAAWP